MRLRKLVLFLALLGGTIPALAQQTVTAGPFMAVLDTSPKNVAPGQKTALDLAVMDSTSMAPTTGLEVAASMSMPAMSGMTLERPIIGPTAAPGHYNIELVFPHAGKYELQLTLRSVSGQSATLTFEITPEMTSSNSGDDMGGMSMPGTLGPWPGNREGSGTSWQPDSSPMFMRMLPKAGRYDLSLMGTLQAGYVDPGSKRVSPQLFSDSMYMLMARRETGGGILGLNFMGSLDPLLNGVQGVPDLFQTGETAHGVPLVDRQHPHNFWSEVSASYSHPLGRALDGFLYLAPIGEPAFGNDMFMHRASGMEVPEAPISHHWFDSTHISFGVVTAGLVLDRKWKLEGSAFNGHEPGENRYVLGPIGLNSASTRLSYNPAKDWSFAASYGYLNSPEALSPGQDEHKFNVSAAYAHAFANGDSLAATAYFGRNVSPGTPHSDAWLAEATLYHGPDSIFSRFERVEKGELYNVPAGDYTINKLVFGDVHNLWSKDGFDYGLGVFGGVYAFPGALKPYYGASPFTWGVFFRVRPSRM